MGVKRAVRDADCCSEGLDSLERQGTPEVLLRTFHGQSHSCGALEPALTPHLKMANPLPAEFSTSGSLIISRGGNIYTTVTGRRSKASMSFLPEPIVNASQHPLPWQ